MKKIILLGRSECGKTTLTQALKGEKIHYHKTQYVNRFDVIIDTPGEYIQTKNLGNAIAMYTFEADVVGLLMSSREPYSLYPPCVTPLCNRPVIGIVTQTVSYTHLDVYKRQTYTSLKPEVTDDIRNNNSPLLISRLLYAVYRWQGTYGNQMKAEKCANRVRKLLLEMRKTQTSCFNFMIPKLALEIIESPGHYHEVMINTETMPPSFWNWFLIGYNKSKEDEDKMLAYTRVYLSLRHIFG